MGADDVLGLTMTWIHVPAYHVMLMLTFALSPATLSDYLKDGRQVLLQAFKHCSAERVQWPDLATMNDLAGLITARQPQLSGVFCKGSPLTGPLT